MSPQLPNVRSLTDELMTDPSAWGELLELAHDSGVLSCPFAFTRLLRKDDGSQVPVTCRARVADHAGRTVVVLFVDETETMAANRTRNHELRGLTPRQVEVAAMLGRRLTTKEIANELGVSIHTARRHIEAVMKKLELSKRIHVGTPLEPSGPRTRKAETAMATLLPRLGEKLAVRLGDARRFRAVRNPSSS